MERRELIQLAAASALAVPPLAAAAKPPMFFTAPEYALLDELCEVIMPADSEGPGAKAAVVRFYIDRMIGHADSSIRDQWRAGLAAVDSLANARFGAAFVKCTPAQRDQIVAAMAANEGRPQTPIERFFAPLKRMTFDGFVLSDAAKAGFFHYKGGHGVAEFAGCTHPEHGKV